MHTFDETLEMTLDDIEDAFRGTDVRALTKDGTEGTRPVSHIWSTCAAAE